MALWQEGIKKVIMWDTHGTKLFNEEQQKIFDLFVKDTGLVVEKINPDLTWLQKAFGVS